MTIIVFVIDSSASMNQRTFIGARPTLLDIAKGAVENFVKLRQRNPESRFDRYMLFTSEEAPFHIKAGWKENLATFMNELKNIRATGLSTLGPAIKNVFDVLNMNRVQSGIDTYGSGRSPFFLEPSLIICITDGGKLSSTQGVQDDIFPLSKSNPIPGAELTKEAFRWDQRLFGLVLRLTGTPTADPLGLVPSDHSPLDKLCEQTGGRSYAVRTHRMFQQCIESLVQKVQSGVVINFEKIGPDPPPIVDARDGTEGPDLDAAIPDGSNAPGDAILSQALAGNVPPQTGLNGINCSAWYQCRKMIYVPRPPHRGNHGCFWPIPESYWPDVNLISLPARSAHPNVKFTCTSQDPMVIDNLPFDKYELEPSPLTQYILLRRQPTVCWQVFISNSSKNSDVGHPFGYLKASTTKLCVNLFVMPYNYPVLLPLLDDLFKTHRLKPTKEWRLHFDNYLRSMPTYYISPLKRALERMGVTNMIPDKYDSSLSFAVVNNLKKLKNQAKIEYDKLCSEVEKRVSHNHPNGSCGVNLLSSTGFGSHDGIRVLSRARPLPKHLTSNHLLQGKLSRVREVITEHSNFTIGIRKNDVQPQMFRNPFDVPRSQLVDQLTRMRANFLQKCPNQLLTDKGPDQLHCKPISQMGNYQDYLKKINPPLREIESAPVRQHMFGNPFKIDKKMSMMVDEADVDLIGSQNGQSTPNRSPKRPLNDAQMYPPIKGPKRRKGPLPADFALEHLLNTPPHSPPVTPPPMCTPMSPLPPLTPPFTPFITPPPASYSPIQAPRPLTPPPFSIAFEEAALSNGIGNHHQALLNGDVKNALKDIKLDDSDSDHELEIDMEAEDGRLPLADMPSGSPTIKVEQRNGVPEAASDIENDVGPDTEEIKQANRQMLFTCYKEVKKPGRDFRTLVDCLSKLQGSADTKAVLVKRMIGEAVRFKRHSAVDLLDKHLQNLQNGLPPRPLTNGYMR